MVLQVEPHECHKKAKYAIPLHVFRRSPVGTLFDDIEIKNQIQRGNDNDEDAEQDAERAA